MASDEEWLSESFFEFSIGGLPDKIKVFTPDVLDPIRVSFDIPDDGALGIAATLEFGAASYLQETHRSKVDQAPLRKQLDAIQKAATKLQTVIAETSPEIWQLLNDSAAGRTLGGVPYPRLIAARQTEDLLGRCRLQFERTESEDVEALDLDLLSQAINALSLCASNGKKAAGEGKRGRPQDDGLFDLMLQAYQVWVRLLGREFRLDWTDDRSPITDAARFTFAVAHAVDPSLSPSRIATASIRARKLGKETLHLEKIPESVEFFFKRFE